MAQEVKLYYTTITYHVLDFILLVRFFINETVLDVEGM